MIDTKIACQCGNRFKFGMDLVNGRAPDGLICPTCGAPATPACNALVDFLSGKEPASSVSGSRPVKEVKVTCACGARYKFDLELAELEMPSPVVCPGCQADLTSKANEEIRSYVARHAASLGTPTAAPAPAPASAVAPSSPLVAVIPPAEPVPAITQTAPAPAVPAAPAPAPSESSAPAAPAVTQVSDPFGPPPPGKSSGPNLKPLDVPRPNRPPPGSKPSAPPAKPPGAAATAPVAKPGKPDPAKPAAKPDAKHEAKPAAASQGPNFGLGVAGAVVGALVGAGIWFAVLKATGRPAGYLALLVGTLAGFAARTLGRGGSTALGGVACVSSLVAIGVMVWMAIIGYVDGKSRPMLENQYKAAVARAQAMVDAKTDAELKPFVSQTMSVADLDSARVSDEALQAFKATELPKQRAFLADKDARAKFEARQRGLYRASYDLEETWGETFGIFGLLFLLGGMLAAAKIAMK